MGAAVKWGDDPVKCLECNGHGRPVWDGQAWRLPLHPWGKGGSVMCPNSMALVPMDDEEVTR